jgi:D-alanyl-D-alanine carboxypeptidase (penicillin-binding protein 5/6)
MRLPSAWSGPSIALVAAVAVAVPVVVPVALAPVAGASDSSTVGGPDLANHGVVSHGRPPVVYAKAWVLADATTGEVLAAKNAHQRMRPASTLKTLTAVTLLPLLDKQQTYRAQYEDAAVEGSAVGIVPGGTYTVDQLFYGMMLPSGNDAAHALASAAGGMRRTVALMSKQAHHLQAYDTTVRNPSGLDASGEYSSAYDLALFARAGLQRDDFRRYVTTTSYAFPGRMPRKGGKRATFMIYNQNPLLTDYRGAMGVKTGFTTLAGRTFVGAARRHGHLLVVALMGVVEPSEDAAARLLTWGFANAGTVDPVGVLLDPLPQGGQPQPSVTSTPVPTSVPAASGLAPTSNGPGGVWALGAAVALLAFFVVLLSMLAGRRSRRPRSNGMERVPFQFRG